MVFAAALIIIIIIIIIIAKGSKRTCRQKCRAHASKL